MSADGQGELEPEVPRKNVVGLFCGAAFHDVVFARVSGCDVVRLYDWELRMRKLACLFFPKRGVVKEMDIRAENIGALEADINPTNRCAWRTDQSVHRCRRTLRLCSSL